jgi:hypothetical protein
MLLLALTLACCGGADGSTGGDGGRPDAPAQAPERVPGVLGMNDVSILFPLPTVATMDRLLSIDSVGGRGVLLPERLRAMVPQFFTAGPMDPARLRAGRVVAARVDPCFRERVDGGEACRHQVRLVLQPLAFATGTDDATRGEDAAMHLFYDLDDRAFRALLVDLVALRARTPELQTDGPLGVHPALAARGVAGAFADELEGILLARIGGENLSRVAMMGLGEMRNQWTFASLDVVDGAPRPVPIPAVGGASVTMSSAVPAGGAIEDDVTARVGVSGAPSDDLLLLLRSDDARSAPRAAVEAAAGAAVRIENPTRHGAGTVDCVSCHVASNARHWAQRALGVDTRESPDRYRSALDLTLTSEATRDRTVMRAFGWSHTQRAISQRTVNETAAALDELRRTWLRAP